MDGSFEKVFDMVVIDPPFITQDVWEKFAITAKHILKDDPTASNANSFVLATTVAENHNLLRRILGVSKTNFRPSIPNLVYQYDTFINFSSKVLSSC